MTLEEIQSEIDRLTPDDRDLLAAYLKHLARKDDPEYQAELGRLNEEFEEGKTYSVDQLKIAHEALASRGL